MKTQVHPRTGFLFLVITGILSLSLHCQVGIGTTSPSPGAALDISSTNKGIMLPRVSLTGTDDSTTIHPWATTGLMVYNRVTAGALPVQVTPGFYYWNSTQWTRLYSQGYSLKFNQTAEARANSSNTVYEDLPGLDTGSLQVPFSGTYQIVVSAFYAAGDLINTSADGAGQASIALALETNGGGFNILKETYATSSSKRIFSTTVNSLAQHISIVVNVDLDATETYQFKVQGREWLTNNVTRGYFGKSTSSYIGSNGVSNAQYGSMNIVLIKQQ